MCVCVHSLGQEIGELSNVCVCVYARVTRTAWRRKLENFSTSMLTQIPWGWSRIQIPGPAGSRHWQCAFGVKGICSETVCFLLSSSNPFQVDPSL